MVVLLELYDVKPTVADLNHLKRTVEEVLGGRVILTLVIRAGSGARIAVIRSSEIPLDVLEELRRGGIEARLVLQSPVLGISEAPEFVRDVLRVYKKFGKDGLATVLSGLSKDYVIEKVGHVVPLKELEDLKGRKVDLETALKASKEISKKRLIRADGTEEQYDPDKVLETLVKCGIGLKLGRRVVELIEGLIEGDFVVDYELSRAIKRALGRVAEYQDIVAYEGYTEYHSRVFIDGNAFSVARLMEIIRNALSFEGFEPSPTLVRQVRDHLVNLIRSMASESTTELYFSSERISDTARRLVLSRMPYMVSKEPRKEAYEEAKREYHIAKSMLTVDRSEAIRSIEKSIEHSLRAIALAKRIVPPVGIPQAIVTVREELSEAMIKRLKALKELKIPYNRYNRGLVNTILEVAEALLEKALEKSAEASKHERDA